VDYYTVRLLNKGYTYLRRWRLPECFMMFVHKKTMKIYKKTEIMKISMN